MLKYNWAHGRHHLITVFNVKAGCTFRVPRGIVSQLQEAIPEHMRSEEYYTDMGSNINAFGAVGIWNVDRLAGKNNLMGHKDKMITLYTLHCLKYLFKMSAVSLVRFSTEHLTLWRTVALWTCLAGSEIRWSSPYFMSTLRSCTAISMRSCALSKRLRVCERDGLTRSDTSMTAASLHCISNNHSSENAENRT